jgi:Cof subfamily protein (haloacid dehalogenase superfamily)
MRNRRCDTDPVHALVATDLDGTLLHSDGTVTERTREVLDAVDRRGITVVFVTGRPIRWMEPLWDHVGDHGLAICSNGGIVYDVPGRAVLEARTIEPQVGLRVAERIRTTLPGSVFALEKTTGFGKEPGFRPRSDPDEGRPELTVGPLEELFDDTVVKLLALHPDLAPDAYWAQVDELVGQAVTTTWSSTGALVEISARGVTKASTLELVCGERGIGPEDVVAFGDMPNDIPMLRWAGTSYAMANAHPTAVAAADHTAPGNDEDGVAAVLEKLFLR